MSNYFDQFRAAMQQHGFIPPADLIADSKPHSFDSEGNGGKKKGWYILHNCTVPFGVFGDWRRGEENHRWQADIGRELTAEEQAALKQEQAALRKQQETDKQDRQAKALDKALKIVGYVQEADESFPYLARKNVKPYDVFVYKSSLVVPVCDVEGYLQSLQFISPDGKDKKFLKGGRKQGCLHMIGEVQDVLCIAEGYATAATIHEATGHAVAVAFDAGNLTAVAQAMRGKYPDTKIVLCADDDWRTDDNKGLAKAKEAAGTVGGLLALPIFGAERGEKDTDFNDMAAASGLDSVKQAIAKTLAINAVAGVTAVTPNNTKDVDGTANMATDVADVTDAAAQAAKTEKLFGYAVHDNWRNGGGGRKLPSGVWYTRTGKSDDEPIEIWICSPVHVDAITADEQENNFGRLLRLRNSRGNWRTWSMPMELLRGSGDEMRGELLAMGVEINPQAKDQLAIYLQSQHPDRHVHCALQVGWCKDVFVLPDSVFGDNAANVIYQSGERGTDEYTQGGTLEGWQKGIAARAVGNPVLTVSLAAAFAGALLKPCHAENGGIHWVGDSSTGKTTGIDAACSVWGGTKYRRSWRTTANGMEAVAALFNDGFLALDEISECDPRDVGAIVYALGNGRGKQRANRLGHARAVTRWACMVLSSGERSMSTTMSDGGQNTKAGQNVRLADVPALRKEGAWDNLHGFEHGAAFSDAVKHAAAQHYGKAGRVFLERLTRDGRNFSEALETIKALPQFGTQNGEGQEKRVAARFALIALAGELATEYSITGWPQGMATNAAAEMFVAWREYRGGSGNDERRKILEQIADFIDRNGDGRFDRLGDTEHPCRDRAGWWQPYGEEGRIYLFTPSGLRDALKGFDLKRALPVLLEAGALPPPNASGERAPSRRINGQNVRVYEIHPDKLLPFATSATATAAPDVTEKTQQTKDVTSVTPATPPKTKTSKITQRGGSKTEAEATQPKGRKRKA